MKTQKENQIIEISSDYELSLYQYKDFKIEIAFDELSEHYVSDINYVRREYGSHSPNYYGDDKLDIGHALRLLDLSWFKRGKRVELLKALEVPLDAAANRDVEAAIYDYFYWKEDKSSLVETICNLDGIPFVKKGFRYSEIYTVGVDAEQEMSIIEAVENGETYEWVITDPFGNEVDRCCFLGFPIPWETITDIIDGYEMPIYFDI